MSCVPKCVSSPNVVVGHFDHLLHHTNIIQKTPRPGARGSPTWFHPSSATLRAATLCGDNGPSRSPILSRDGDLRDPLPGGFPACPVKGACSLRPPLSWTFTGQYSSRSALSQCSVVATPCAAFLRPQYPPCHAPGGHIQQVYSVTLVVMCVTRCALLSAAS